MSTIKKAAIGVSVAGLLAGCATIPMGPRIAAMPPPNKPYDAFQQDDAFCRGQGANAVQGQVEAANNAQVGGALFTTVLGAALGAAVGGGHGAAIGAAAGAGAGSLYGVNAAQWQQLSIQQRYDIVYAQCMHSRGDIIPAYSRPRYRPYPPPPPGGYAPPPPPPGGYAPPPGGYPPPPPGGMPPGPPDE